APTGSRRCWPRPRGPSTWSGPSTSCWRVPWRLPPPLSGGHPPSPGPWRLPPPLSGGHPPSPGRAPGAASPSTREPGPSSRTGPTWKPSYIAANEVGPLGALLVNDGFTVFDQPIAQRAADPAVHAAGELTRLAEATGISVAGPSASGIAPEKAVVLATVRSA